MGLRGPKDQNLPSDCGTAAETVVFFESFGDDMLDLDEGEVLRGRVAVAAMVVT